MIPPPPIVKITSHPSFLDKYLLDAAKKQSFNTRETSAPDYAFHVAGHGDLSLITEQNAKACVIIIPPGINADAEISLIKERIPTAILRTAHIVGTGMEGILIKIASMIERGTYFHIKENDARVSVVHALDVARVAMQIASGNDDFTISDEANPSWRELTEAISVRLGHKRIPTVGRRMAKWLGIIGPIWGGPDKNILQTITTDQIIPSTLPDYLKPTINVTKYLSTHIYDETDI